MDLGGFTYSAQLRDIMFPGSRMTAHHSAFYGLHYEFACQHLSAERRVDETGYYAVKDGGVFRVRLATVSAGISFTRAAHVGKGRTYNDKEFLADLESIDGFVIVDLTAMLRFTPRVSVYRIHSDDVLALPLEKGKLAWSDYQALKPADLRTQAEKIMAFAC